MKHAVCQSEWFRSLCVPSGRSSLTLLNFLTGFPSSPDLFKAALYTQSEQLRQRIGFTSPESGNAPSPRSLRYSSASLPPLLPTNPRQHLWCSLVASSFINSSFSRLACRPLKLRGMHIRAHPLGCYMNFNKPCVIAIEKWAHRRQRPGAGRGGVYG
jgi:hypothetical protein